MRFEAVVKRDKLKLCEGILTMCISIIKSRPLKYCVYFIYVANQNEVRILIQSEVVPIIMVLTSDMFSRVVSVSRNEATNSSIGFEFKNGLSFLENLLYSIKDDSGNITLP